MLKPVIVLIACLAFFTGEPMDAQETERKHTNRLAGESSPYLLQHAQNPVDWYPWGDEAFEKARKEDKPVFLSIGYATCHWCHVMERESFENEEVAALMNQLFVSIKVDREERPDVDNIYMAAVQAISGGGGWPLSVFLAPDGRPLWGGTYFPPEDRYGRPGFRTVLRGMSDAWRNKREEMLKRADQLTGRLRRMTITKGEAELGEDTLEEGFDLFSRSFDGAHGGFEKAPKFPRTHGLSFLLRRLHRDGSARALAMVEQTLMNLWRGGVYDHLGGGFHRYSTDAEWLVPHFEKMLYDQALAARAYLEAYQVTKNERYAWIVRDILKYVLRDMTDERGGFYSAEDADAEGVEGRFQVWSHEELLLVLGDEDGVLFAEVYGARPGGNFREEATGEDTGLNILHLPAPLAEAAKARGMSAEALETRLAPLREKLFQVREKRVHPQKDDKVLTDWNGLMISTLACAGRVLGEEEYTRAATRAAGFLLETMQRDGALLHRYRDGVAGIPAFLDDYAFLSLGLADLYEATFDARWLAAAKVLVTEMDRRFRDRDGGGYYFSAHDGETLVSRTKELYDGAIPSGNSVATLALLRIGRLTADSGLEKRGHENLKAFSGLIEGFPMGYPFMLMALDFAVGPTREIVLAEGGGELDAMRRLLDGSFLPRSTLAFHPQGEAAREIEALAPYTKPQVAVDGKAAAYVCNDFACHEPVTTVEALKKLLATRD